MMQLWARCRYYIRRSKIPVEQLVRRSAGQHHSSSPRACLAHSTSSWSAGTRPSSRLLSPSSWPLQWSLVRLFLNDLMKNWAEEVYLLRVVKLVARITVKVVLWHSLRISLLMN